MPVAYAILDPAPAAMLAQAVAGTGPVVDLGPRSSLRLRVAVAAVAGVDAALVLTVETSDDGLTWRTLGTLPRITAPGPVRAVLPGADRYIRVGWALAGAGATFTFGVTGVAYRSYATPAQLALHGLPPVWLAGVDAETQDTHLVAASDKMDRYLGKQHALPLAAPYPPSLADLCAQLARWTLMTRKGFNPENGADIAVRQGHQDAMRELHDISHGAAEIVDAVDATPDVDDGGSVLVSDRRRRA